jgi:hypothetical protein
LIIKIYTKDLTALAVVVESKIKRVGQFVCQLAILMINPFIVVLIVIVVLIAKFLIFTIHVNAVKNKPKIKLGAQPSEPLFTFSTRELPSSKANQSKQEKAQFLIN